MNIRKLQEQLIKKYISGEISDAEISLLKSFSKDDNSIRDILEVHSILTDKDFQFENADKKEFEKMRAITLNKIQHKELRKKEKSSFSVFSNFGLLIKKPAFSYSFAVIMFVAGFFLNRNTQPSAFIDDIKLTAMKSETIAGSYNSPFIFSNATFKENSDGQISVNFDVSRHIEMQGSKDDPLVKEVLAQSLLNSQTESQRLRNIDATQSIMDPKIKQALILTMLNDNNVVVRQKSLFSLIRYPNDRDTQDALLKVLKNEESTYMRLAAVDYLSNNNIEVSSMFQELNNEDYLKNSAVFEKLQQINQEERTLK
ncbi:MAG: HEAT repeat domain-containing protein [Calditrichae bacterium]|nr:HEAT repeat domain-containing protein [Calditrichia bacterium]